ncbi:MAG TPA: alpha/beta hydrolase-fold protein, partial [Polyangia bacterium]|nr:alpha/beta hydrolase-fold protein [Polyangia bacterium]
MKLVAPLVIASAFPLPLLAQTPAQTGLPAPPAASAPVPAPAPSGPPYLSPEVHADRRVTFRIQAPRAGEVALNADWLPTDKPKLAKGDKGIWSVTVGPLAPGVYIYSFNIDGVAMPDALNPDVKLRARTAGSMVTIPGPEPGFWEYRDVPHGTVEINWHRSSALGATRAVHVYLPPGYTRNWTKKYPVVYLLHGRNGTSADWIQAGFANFILDNLIAEKKAVPMIVVMPWAHALAFDASTPDNNDALEKYLLADLIPYIEGKYRVLANRQSRALVGLSMGGAAALTTGLSHLDLFSQLAAFSAGAPAGEIDKRIAPALGKPEATNKQLKLLWISVGQRDSLLGLNQALSKSLTEHHIKHTFEATPDGVHNWTIWREYL